ncbi:MAG: hypothetical protein ACOYL6_15260 [Bacteriovoracaceae bacterium]
MKSRMTNILLLTLLVTFSLNLNAGGETGNGGDGIVCKSRDGFNIEMYDIYEGQVKRKIDIDFYTDIPNLTSYQDYLFKTLSMIRELDPVRFHKYTDWGRSFMSESTFTYAPLVDIPDAGVSVLEPGCHLVQLAVQETPTLPGDYRYTIDAELWNRLNDFHRSALILHELILREAIEESDYKHTNTKYVRYFNSILHSEKLKTMGTQEYIQEVQLSKLKTY